MQLYMLTFCFSVWVCVLRSARVEIRATGGFLQCEYIYTNCLLFNMDMERVEMTVVVDQVQVASSIQLCFKWTIRSRLCFMDKEYLNPSFCLMLIHQINSARGQCCAMICTLKSVTPSQPVTATLVNCGQCCASATTLASDSC